MLLKIRYLSIFAQLGESIQKVFKHINEKIEKIIYRIVLSSISVKQKRHANPAYEPFPQQLQFIYTKADESIYPPQDHNAYTCPTVLVVHMNRSHSSPFTITIYNLIFLCLLISG